MRVLRLNASGSVVVAAGTPAGAHHTRVPDLRDGQSGELRFGQCNDYGSSLRCLCGELFGTGVFKDREHRACERIDQRTGSVIHPANAGECPAFSLVSFVTGQFDDQAEPEQRRG